MDPPAALTPGQVRDAARTFLGLDAFEEREAGPCEECGRDRLRYRYGRFSLCWECCRRRARVAAGLSGD